MDLKPQVSHKAHKRILRKIKLASCKVAGDFMKNSAKEKIPASGSNGICVSGDGTWITLRHTLRLVRAVLLEICQVIYSQFGLAIHQNDHQARRRFVEWAQNEIAVVPDFHKRILFSDEAHFWLNGYVNKQNCRIWSKANPQVYVETPLHPGKLTVWCALWAGGILLQKR
ncbi:hypothetical protein TNCV_168701 [Trichonephila clavipes]|nr:hypothetical protein TNCV_168701 [Trichonephila clavipes]